MDDSTLLLRAAGHRVNTLRMTATSDVASGDELVFPRTFDPLSGYRHRANFRRTVAALAPDIVHVHAGFTAVAAVLMRDLARNYPTVGQFHDVGSFSQDGSAGGLTDRDRVAGVIPRLRGAVHSLIKADLLATWRHLSRIVVPSTYLRDLAARHGFSSEKLRVVSNFCPSKGTNSHTPTDPPLILFVGSLLHIKGVHLLLEALARLAGHRWRAIIVGEGEEAGHLLAQAEALALSERVTFAGNLDRDEVGALYSQCRMLVHTSTIPESFGLVGIEAMAHGRPVVGFRLGGVNEWLLDHETGLAVEPWSVAALADSMLTLLQDPALATQLGAAARARTQALFTPDIFLDKTLAVYAEAISDWRHCS